MANRYSNEGRQEAVKLAREIGWSATIKVEFSNAR